MATYYVATTGSNSNNGAIGTPWLTLTYALTQVSAGDTINMREGTYNENVQITSGGSSGNPITIQAYGAGSNPEAVWLSGNNYTLPTGDSYSGGTYEYGTWYAANYTGMIDIRASYIVIDGINVKESRGRGIEMYTSTWEAGPHITDITIKNLTISGCRQAGMVSQGADNMVIDNVTVTDTGNYAPFHRPVRAGQPGNHPAAVNFKYGTGLTLTNYTVYACWGEGVILSMELYDFLVDGFTAYDVMSGLLYVHRCEDGIIRNFVLYYSDSGTPAQAMRGVAMNINNEDPKFTETSYCSNIKIYNGLIVGAERAISILGGDGGTIPFEDLKFWNITIVNPTARDPLTDTPIGIRVAAQAIVSGIEFANIVVHSSNTDAEITQTPNRTGLVTWRYNCWHYAADPDSSGTGDVVSDPILVNPDVSITAGALNANNYKLSPESPARFAGVTLADVTDDYFGNSRNAPYSMGFDQAGTSTGGGDPDPGGSPTGDLEFGVARATAPTSTGTTTLTDANMTLTPKAAIVVANKATSISSGEATYAGASISIGFYDGTTQAVLGIRSKDNDATTSDNRTRGATDMVAMLLNDGSTAVDGELSATGFSTGAISTSAAVAPTNAMNLMAMLFAGDDFNAKVNVHQFSASDTSKVVSGLSWQPNLFFAISSEALIDDSVGANCNLIFGMATGASVKYSYAFFSDAGETAASVAALLSTGGLIDSFVDNQTYNVAPASDGYTITRTGDNGARHIAVLACRIDNAAISLSLEDTPTATGTDSYSVGFESSIAMVFSTLIQAVNTDYTDSDANGFGIGMFTENAAHAMGFTDEDGADPTDTEAIYGARAIALRQVVGTEAIDADWDSFDASNVILDYNATLAAARKMMLLAIEKVTNASISVTFFASATTGVVPKEIGFVGFVTATNTTATSWVYNFGDGQQGTGSPNTTHEYTTAGIYTVTFTASDGVISGSQTRTAYITLTDPPPPAPDFDYVAGGAFVSSTTQLAIRGGGVTVS